LVAEPAEDLDGKRSNCTAISARVSPFFVLGSNRESVTDFTRGTRLVAWSTRVAYSYVAKYLVSLDR